MKACLRAGGEAYVRVGKECCVQIQGQERLDVCQELAGGTRHCTSDIREGGNTSGRMRCKDSARQFLGEKQRQYF